MSKACRVSFTLWVLSNDAPLIAQCISAIIDGISLSSASKLNKDLRKDFLEMETQIGILKNFNF